MNSKEHYFYGVQAEIFSEMEMAHITSAIPLNSFDSYEKAPLCAWGSGLSIAKSSITPVAGSFEAESTPVTEIQSYGHGVENI